jgi:glycosyltransferase involved in cell wall biosynthesis
MKPTCIISCPIDTFSGYGHRSRDFVRSLIEAKGEEWDVKILPQKWGNTPWGFLDKDDPLRKYFSPGGQLPRPEIFIQITIPSEFQPLGKYNIGVTAGIESTVPPHEWVQGMNRMDLNLVSSEFTKNTFSTVSFSENNNQGQVIGELKLEKPIEVLFEGLDTGVYFKEVNKSGLLNNIDESFCFLFTGHWLPGNFGEDRKNVATMIKTFLETFKGNKKLKGPKPALLLKVNKVDYSLLDKEEILKDIRKIRNEFNHKEDLPNIYILHGEFTNEELNKINNDPKIKAFISFTKGEGFGRPLLEQAITGKPVIATNWSGHVDFIKPEYNLLIGGELKNIHPSASNQWLLKEAQWFNINTEIASKAMKDLYKNYKKYIEQSRKQTKFLSENFSKDKMTETLKNYLDKINPVVNVLPTLELPKLKRTTSQQPQIQLPKLKKTDSTPKLPQLKLPKLKKAEV